MLPSMINNSLMPGVDDGLNQTKKKLKYNINFDQMKENILSSN